MKDPNQKYEWNGELEALFQRHKSEIRLGLTHYATTGPWNKVVLGQMDQLRSDIPKKSTQNNQAISYKGL